MLMPIQPNETIEQYKKRRDIYISKGGCKGSVLKCYGIIEFLRGVPRCVCKNKI